MKTEHSLPHPLADRMRPKVLADLVGQDHLTGENGVLRHALASKNLPSMILAGPPGVGKTTLARLLSHETDLIFEPISAIFSGIAELKKIFENARTRRRMGQGTLLFVDEIHRFNRTQQDSFLPVMEDGTITLIGATTENPSFALNNALLSRARVLTFHPLDEEAILKLFERAETFMARPLPLNEDTRKMLAQMCDGDGRAALTFVEEIWRNTQDPTENMDEQALQKLLQRRAPLYDKSEDGHYNLISALHKSVRGSDPDAALYYFCRMCDGGEDPRFLARRLVRMAVEDIGLADPQALIHARAAAEAYEQLGSPEGELALANAVLYLATAPKSNAAYRAWKKAYEVAQKAGSLAPPKTILNAPTNWMKKEGYGANYAYDHDAPHAFSGQNYWPDVLGRQHFYDPPERGFEREIKKRLEFWEKLRKEQHKNQ